MPIPRPNLDNTSFAEIVEEAKKQIPIFSSLWTDFNESDPGITFIELFAWLVDMQIYSLNRIPNSNYLKYLDLLGARVLGARPSQTYVTFTSDNIYEFIAIKKKTKIRPYTNELNEDIFFETDDDIFLAPLRIKKVETYSNNTLLLNKDVTEAASVEGTFFYAFGDQPQIGNSFNICFESNIQEEELDECYPSSMDEKQPAIISLFISLYESDLPPVGQHGSMDALEEPILYISSKVQWEYQTIDKKNGNREEWIKFDSNKIRDRTLGLTKSGLVTIEFPDKINDENNKIKSGNLLCIRCRFEGGEYDIPPRIEAISLNAVSATHGVTIEEDLVNVSSISDPIIAHQDANTSNGLPNQVFKVGNNTNGHIPIITVENLTIVLPGNEPRSDWTKVNDFDSSNPQDTHYILDNAKGIISFGDGIKGMIPEYGAKAYMKFRYGDTDGVYLKSGTTFEVLDGNISGIGVVQCNSVSNSSVGIGQETLNGAFVRARRELKMPLKAVSASDFEYIAVHTPGLRVARAKAFSMPPPDENLVKVIVVPCSLSKNPIPNKEFLRTVSEHLDKHRLLTTNVQAIGPVYVAISIEMKITLKPNIKPEFIKDRLRKRLFDFLSSGSCIQKSDSQSRNTTTSSGWEFGKAVYRSDVYAQIGNVEGVDRVRDLRLVISSGHEYSSYDEDGNVIIKELCLVYLQSCSVAIISEDDKIIDIWSFS